MNLLYGFRYRQRFRDIIAVIPGNAVSITELCFGDIYIAGECRRKEIRWTGIDINSAFVKFAGKKSYHAIHRDISIMDDLPPADVCIMSGSLYHFHFDLENIILKMLHSAPVVILSEPVINLSSGNGWIGKLSRRFTNAGKGHENFRFDEKILLETLEQYKLRLDFTYRTISVKKDMLIIISHERYQRSNSGL